MQRRKAAHAEPDAHGADDQQRPFHLHRKAGQQPVPIAPDEPGEHRTDEHTELVAVAGRRDDELAVYRQQQEPGQCQRIGEAVDGTARKVGLRVQHRPQVARIQQRAQ